MAQVLDSQPRLTTLEATLRAAGRLLNGRSSEHEVE